MKLFSSTASPFVRKVNIVARLKGLDGRIEHLFPDATKGDAALNHANPLGRLPTLVSDSGVSISDSHVICEYLDATGTGPALFPASGDARWDTLTRASTADGILEAALLIVYEKRFRAENMYVASWVERQHGKINKALAELEAKPPKLGAHLDYGHITLACALGYLDFRHAGTWRAAHPKLVAWLAAFDKACPAFAETTPKDPPK